MGKKASNNGQGASSAAGSTDPGSEFAKKLRQETAAVRLRRERFGLRRAFSHDQKAEAAEPFEADPASISASKKLLDARDPSYRAVTQILRRAADYWTAQTTPYPEPGIRLLRRDRIPEFTSRMKDFATELDAALATLQEQYETLRKDAQEKLGKLFHSGDYPASIAGEFSLAWEFPSVDPPNYLKELNPELYKAEQERISKRFEESVRMAEEAFASEFGNLIEHLTERLSGEKDGKPKSFQKSTLENLNSFFERFKLLNIRSNPDLDRLVSEAQAAMKGIDSKRLKEQVTIRSRVAEALGKVQEGIGKLAIAKPKRSIILDDATGSEANDDAAA